MPESFDKPTVIRLLSDLERRDGVSATRHRISKPRSRRRELLAALVLIVAGVALAALIGLLRK